MRLKSLLALPLFSVVVLTRTCKPCTPNACLSAAASSDCSSYMITTITPPATTIYRTQTFTTVPTELSSVVANATFFITATSIASAIETDTFDIVATSTVEVDVTDIVSTVTEFSTIPALQARQATIGLSSMPASASACQSAAAYSSACSCIGIRASTVTASQPTSSVLVDLTITQSPVIVPTTISTAQVSEVDATQYLTDVYSTETDLETVSTALASYTAVASATATQFVTVDPTLAIYITISMDTDPEYNGASYLYGYLSAYQGSTSVYYIDFTADGSQAQEFIYDYATGHITVADGSIWGYLNSDQTSYVNVAPESYIDDNGAVDAVCLLNDDQTISCRFDTNNFDAVFWTCDGRLDFAQEGFDFSQRCADASTSYQATLNWQPAFV